MSRASRLTVVVALLLSAASPARAQSRDLQSYVLFALQELRTKGPSLQSGNLGVNQPTGSLSVSPHGQLVAPESQVVGDVVTGSAASVCKQLFSNLVLRNMVSCGPAGALTLPIIADPLGACGFPSVFPACSSDSTKTKVVLDGSLLRLGPDTYGDVRVLSGGALLLDGGDYRFCSLRVGRNGKVLVQNAATLNVAGLVNIGNNAYLGPNGSGSTTVSPRDVRLFANGTMVHFAGHADVHATVCAPGALLRVTRDAHLQGTFVAGTIHTEHITGELPPTTTTSTTTTLATTSTTSKSTTTTSTTRPSTTTTTLPNCSRLCGNGHIDASCHEQCDGKDFGQTKCPGGSVAGAFLVCNPDCTIDFEGCPNALACGDGVKQSFEECDPVALDPGCPAGKVCGAAGTAVGCRCVQPEICSNCIDDDGNGLTDFEDPACCAQLQRFDMVVRHGRLKPRGSVSKLRLKTLLAQSGLAQVNPLREDVFLQIRPESGGELLCARIPASDFMRMHGAFKFWDRKHVVASAKGINDLTVKVRRDGSVRLRTLGKRVQMQTPAHGPLHVTVGFHDLFSESGNRCSATLAPFRTGRQGRLVTP